MSKDAAQPLAALRLYFPVASRISVRRFWHRLLAPQLAQHLLSVAKKSTLKRRHYIMSPQVIFQANDYLIITQS
jgi:hypothetical protein